MLRLGQVINPHAVSVINQLGSVKMNVPEKAAYRAFVKKVQPYLADWQELLKDFKEKVDAKDPETMNEFQTQWTRDVDVEKLPCSFLDKLPDSSPNEDTALQEMCESKEQMCETKE